MFNYGVINCIAGDAGTVTLDWLIFNYGVFNWIAAGDGDTRFVTLV
jgi:hypothetical protein